MGEAYIGEIYQFGFDWAPKSFALCDGQLLSIAQNTALFSLIGTTFGGNGQTNFALPDLRGRTPIAPGMDVPDQGMPAGQETVTLTANEALHNHPLKAVNADGNAATPFNLVTFQGYSLANVASGGSPVYGTANNLFAIGSGSVTNAGGSIPHQNMQPYLTISFCIALYGVFPSRN